MYDLNDDFQDSQSEFNINNIEDTMMEMVYETIIKNIDEAICSNTPINEKITALTSVLKHFENNEEYEKCGNIKKIIENIQC